MTEMRHALTHSDPSACGGECWPSEALDLAAIDRLLAVEHREDDQPCSCDECMEYGAEDAGADWYRMPAANRIAIRILDGADTRLAVLAAAFRDHDAAVDELPVHTIVGPDVGPDLTTPERCPSGIHWVTGPYAEPPCSCAAAPLPSEPVGRWEAVKQAPLLSDLRDAICFVERHDHLATSSYCQAGRAQAYRIREALIARYQFAAPLPSEPTHPHDGFAYDGCKCVCCVNIRALANPAIIEERDRAEEWADRLAYAIGGAAIGEHSNLNNPWQNALDMAAPLPSDTPARTMSFDSVNATGRPSDTPADGLDVEELTDIIEQAIFETDTGLAAAMLAAGRIAALTQEPRSTREEAE